MVQGASTRIQMSLVGGPPFPAPIRAASGMDPELEPDLLVSIKWTFCFSGNKPHLPDSTPVSGISRWSSSRVVVADPAACSAGGAYVTTRTIRILSSTRSIARF